MDLFNKMNQCNKLIITLILANLNNIICVIKYHNHKCLQHCPQIRQVGQINKTNEINLNKRINIPQCKRAVSVLLHYDNIVFVVN